MNYGRLVAAAVAATVSDAVYGFLVYGTLMASEFGKYPNVYRPADVGQAFLPYVFAGMFVALIAATAIYAKGYEGGSGASEGARFGALLGALMVGAFACVSYGILNINKEIALMLAAAGFFEWILAGVVIGLVYKPGASRSR